MQHLNILGLAMERYEKIRKIGEGAFGIAWLANSKRSKSLKVIKEIGISRVMLLLLPDLMAK